MIQRGNAIFAIQFSLSTPT